MPSVKQNCSVLLPEIHHASPKTLLTAVTHVRKRETPAGDGAPQIPAHAGPRPRQKKPQEVLMTNLVPRDSIFQDLFDFRRDFDQIFNRFLSWPSTQEERTLIAGFT